MQRLLLCGCHKFERGSFQFRTLEMSNILDRDFSESVQTMLILSHYYSEEVKPKLLTFLKVWEWQTPQQFGWGNFQRVHTGSVCLIVRVTPFGNHPTFWFLTPGSLAGSRGIYPIWSGPDKRHSRTSKLHRIKSPLRVLRLVKLHPYFYRHNKLECLWW